MVFQVQTVNPADGSESMRMVAAESEEDAAVMMLESGLIVGKISETDLEFVPSPPKRPPPSSQSVLLTKPHKTIALGVSYGILLGAFFLWSISVLLEVAGAILYAIEG